MQQIYEKNRLNILEDDQGFYFLRHGQTDFNLNRVFNDSVDVSLNKTGVAQCLLAKEKIKNIEFETVLFSPLKRAVQTKKLLFSDSTIASHLMLKDLKECTSDVWKKMLSLEKNDVVDLFFNEQNLEIDIVIFLNQTFEAITKILNTKGPRLVIAHGGVFCAISNLLGITTVTKIDNCKLCYFSVRNGKWTLKIM